ATKLAPHTTLCHTSYTSLSLHDALPIYLHVLAVGTDNDAIERSCLFKGRRPGAQALHLVRSQGGLRDADHCAPIFAKLLIRKGADRKSTRLNSSHVAISYAVFCLKKKIK